MLLRILQYLTSLPAQVSTTAKRRGRGRAGAEEEGGQEEGRGSDGEGGPQETGVAATDGAEGAEGRGGDSRGGKESVGDAAARLMGREEDAGAAGLTSLLLGLASKAGTHKVVEENMPYDTELPLPLSSLFVVQVLSVALVSQLCHACLVAGKARRQCDSYHCYYCTQHSMNTHFLFDR